MAKKYLGLMTVCCLMFIFNTIHGQEVQLLPDEITALKKLAEYNTRWNAFLNVWAFLGPILAIIATVIGLRNTVRDWADKEITKKASEKSGFDWAVVKQLVEERNREIAAQKSKRVAVINSKGKYKDIDDNLTQSGYKTDDYRQYDVLPENLDITSCEILVVDNSEGVYQEENVVSFFENMNKKVHLIYLTNIDLSEANFKKYNGAVKIIKLMDRLGNTIKMLSQK